MKVHTTIKGESSAGELFTIGGKAVYKSLGQSIIIINPEINIYCEEDDNCIMISGFEQEEADKGIFKQITYSFFPLSN